MFEWAILREIAVTVIKYIYVFTTINVLYFYVMKDKNKTKKMSKVFFFFLVV